MVQMPSLRPPPCPRPQRAGFVELFQDVDFELEALRLRLTLPHLAHRRRQPLRQHLGGWGGANLGVGQMT